MIISCPDCGRHLEPYHVDRRGVALLPYHKRAGGLLPCPGSVQAVIQGRAVPRSTAEIMKQAWVAGWVAGVTEPGAPRDLTPDQIAERASVWFDEFAGEAGLT